MSDRRAASPAEISLPGLLFSRRRRPLLSLAEGLLSRARAGRLVWHRPDGGVSVFGGGEPGPSAEIFIRDETAVRSLFLGGAVGFGESWMDGAWWSPDPMAVLLFGLLNEDAVGGSHARGPLAWLHRLAHLTRPNTRRGSRRNIAAHYDLGNDFYRLWLDAGMTYSSALYSDKACSLDQAQDAKMERVAELLDLSGGENILEIGCGWGGMIEHLCDRHDARMVGLTLSREQAAWATDRLAGRAAEVRLQDYRDVGGMYDRIVSIEMIEAVGEAHWPVYFKTLHDRLRPGGVAVIQAITIAEDRFPAYRRAADFIQRYVFPGGMLPTPQIIAQQAAQAGLELELVQPFGLDYARTLGEWRRRFQARWPEIAPHGFDERFRRLWDFYLAYCEAGFRAATVDVGFYRLRRT